jgi:hypothetical protein
MDLRLAKCEKGDCIDIYKDIDNERLALTTQTATLIKGDFGMYHNNIMYIIWSFDNVIHLINHEFMHGILDLIDGIETCYKYHAINEKVENWIET